MNINTVIINYFISNGLCTVFVVLFWHQNRSRFAGFDFWLAGFTMQITGIALLVFRSIAPDLIPNEFFRSGSFNALIIILHQMLFTAGAFGLFLMVNRRLVSDLEHDVMGRKQVESELRLSEEKFLKAFHASPDAILISRVQDGKLVEVNEGFCRLTGYSQHEALSSSSIRLDIWEKPQDREAALSALQKSQSVRNLEYNFRTKYGSILNCIYSGELIELGGETHVLSVIRDITERLQKETSLHQVQSQVIEQQRALATFEERERTARDLHDGIGQTLGYVNFQTQAVHDLLVRNEKESAIQLLERLVEVVQEAHEDVRGHILGLKSSNTVSTHQDFLTALMQYCEHLRQTYEFQVELLLPENLPLILATTAVETQLIYIIREALSNAQRHSGVSQASVMISLDEINIHFSVKDMGNGISQNYTGPERRKVAHFGLEMMRERADQVGGLLQIETTPGTGMQVSGWLPRKLSTEDLPSARILLVDDHPLFLDGLRNLLTVRGMQVIGTASDGFEALEAARKMQPDIIAMDIQMPRCNGLEATRLIKAEMPNIKIVMLTTSADEENLFEALQNGASGYLLKATGIDEFLELLSGLTRGESIFSPGLANKTLEVFTRQRVGKPMADLKEPAISGIELTERQLEVLRLASQGLMYKEIGSRLFLTERTVKYHIGEILGRLHLKTRREAIDYAKDKGLV
ncbi:MAG: response regulator [Anaerolineales bacterium]|uniref:response regulator n=1 Tax=Candidatus Villigracilis proximus TaxID=3140683 RepID=UPI003136E462|nr:response regulator [Anaerolineales bacterium]